MTDETPGDEGISAMVDIARMSGLDLNPAQRAELDRLVAGGLIEKTAAAAQVNASKILGEIHVRLCRPVRKFPAHPDVGGGAVIFDVACGEPGLYPRGAASLQRRCIQAVRSGDSGCRPRHGLHGPAANPAQPRLPGLFQARTRGRARYRGKTAQHQAGPPAQTAQTQEVRIAQRAERRRAFAGDRRGRPARPEFSSACREASLSPSGLVLFAPAARDRR